MPRVRQYSDKYAEEDFRREVESKRGWYDLKSNEKLGIAAGMSTSTTRSRLMDPGSLTIRELRSLIKVLHLDIWAVLKFIGYETKEVNKAKKQGEEEPTCLHS